MRKNRYIQPRKIQSGHPFKNYRPFSSQSELNIQAYLGLIPHEFLHLKCAFFFTYFAPIMLLGKSELNLLISRTK